MKKVSIDFKNIQSAGGMSQTEQHRYKGTLRYDEGFWVLSYKESPAVNVAVRIKEDESSVKAERFSVFSNSILIEKGRTTRTIYKTDVGNMLFDFKADNIRIKENTVGIEFLFSYYILQNRQIINHCDIIIKCEYM